MELVAEWAMSRCSRRVGPGRSTRLALVRNGGRRQEGAGRADAEVDGRGKRDYCAAEGEADAGVEMTGHHSGAPFMGIPASDKAFAIEQFHLVEVNSDGRGVRHWANIALDELKRQLT